ncbi:M23 family metallopeptidase [Sinomonas halotolerans]|uniref:Peptidoglycan DD-metalloendopeptidase family protein n=1 Tax=Sinomonas halotolerans TaxID=1644133 RepID=A0ABU9WXT8_9MICC
MAHPALSQRESRLSRPPRPLQSFRIALALATSVVLLALGSVQALASDVLPVTADPDAVVSFDRTDVRSIPGGHTSPVVVASRGLPRPVEGSLYAPLEKLVPSSGFGYRVSPLTGEPGEFHWGQDFSAACGTHVYSADAGRVRAAGWHPWGGGNRLEVDHGNGIITTYNHLEGIAVEPGERVEVGQVIGLVGTTGSSTGCHLHFETLRDGRHVDPAGFTLIPIRQSSPIGALRITDYTPQDGKARNGRQPWAIPAEAEQPATGETVVPAEAPAPPRLEDPTPVQPDAAPVVAEVPAPGSDPTTTASPTPSPTPTVSPSPTSSPTPSPAPAPTASPTPSETATPTPSETATPTPSETATPTPSETATPTPSETAAPSPTATATEAPTSTPEPTP